MNSKQRLQTILDGGVPGAHPTWELVFQIQETFFGMKPRSDVRNAVYGRLRGRLLHAGWQQDHGFLMGNVECAMLQDTNE